MRSDVSKMVRPINSRQWLPHGDTQLTTIYNQRGENPLGKLWKPVIKLQHSNKWLPPKHWAKKCQKDHDDLLAFDSLTPQHTAVRLNRRKPPNTQICPQEEMQIKTTVRYHLTPLRWVIIKKTRDNKCWAECGKKGITAGKNVNCCSHYGKRYIISSKY